MSHTGSENMSLPELARHCAEQTELYFRHLAFDAQYCFELFKRAIRHAEQTAWDLIHVQYEPLVSGWVRQHPGFEATGEEVQYFVNGAFGKISVSLTAEKFGRFTDLPALLMYLKRCVHSVIVDCQRMTDPVESFDFDESWREPAADPAVEELAAVSETRRALWEWVRSRLNTEKERVVIYSLYVLDMKPRELYEKSRGLFEGVGEIYRILQNVVARLRRDPEARKFLDLLD